MNKSYIMVLMLAVLTLSSTPKVYAVVEETATPTSVVTPRAKITTAIKEANLQRVKTTVTTLYNDRFIKQLVNLKTRVETNPKWGSDAKTAVIARINTEITWFESKRNTITSATTVEQVRTIATEGRTRFQENIKDIRKLMITSGFVNALETVITNMEKNIIPRTEEKLKLLSDKGVNVSGAQNHFDKAKAHVAAAKELLPVIRNSTTLESAKANYDAAKEQVKEAREDFRQMVTVLKSTVEELKKNKKVKTTPSVTTTPVATETPSI